MALAANGLEMLVVSGNGLPGADVMPFQCGFDHRLHHMSFESGDSFLFFCHLSWVLSYWATTRGRPYKRLNRRGGPCARPKTNQLGKFSRYKMVGSFILQQNPECVSANGRTQGKVHQTQNT